jgi:hypothetical protein
VDESPLLERRTCIVPQCRQLVAQQMVEAPLAWCGSVRLFMAR